MSPILISVLSLGCMVLCLPVIWKGVVLRLNRRAAGLCQRYKEPALHRDALLRLYLITGLLSAAAAYYGSQHLLQTFAGPRAGQVQQISAFESNAESQQ